MLFVFFFRLFAIGGFVVELLFDFLIALSVVGYSWSFGLLAEWLSLLWFCLIVPCFWGWFVFLLQGGFCG